MNEEKQLVLVVDDEPELVELVRFNFEQEGFAVEEAYDGTAALELARQLKPDLIVLDRMLPEMEGLEVCRHLRQDRETTDLPILMLTALGAESDRIAGYETGADDYVTKPFSVRELIVRARALLRRRSSARPESASLPTGHLLLGNIALRRNFISRKQLQEALAYQERTPWRRLGRILVDRKLLTEKQLSDLLDLQEKAVVRAGDLSPEKKQGLIGRLLIQAGLSTEAQINEALRLQGRLVESGIRPIPRLGEILVRQGHIEKEAIDLALYAQKLLVQGCVECGASVDLTRSNGKEPRCGVCGEQIPEAAFRAAGAALKVIEEASEGQRVSVPPEVEKASRKPDNLFGRYILVETIGRGGSGTVYRAWQPDQNRMVALKTLRHRNDPESSTPLTPFGEADDVKRFYAEARATAELSHPNIVPLLDYGSVGKKNFLVMQLVDGRGLDEILRDRDSQILHQPKELAWSVSVIKAVCRAVAHAHDKGIHHRDIKPGNVLIDHENHIWITDFGLAKVLRIGDPAYEKGLILGTSFYMPPEQALGDMERVDHLSDVYSIGAILYEMLAGHPPFHGHLADDVIDLLLVESPEPIEQVASKAPVGLQRIVHRALSRSKSKRFPSVRNMLREIERVTLPRSS